MKKLTLLQLLLPYQKSLFLNNKKRKIGIFGRQCGKSHTIAYLLVYKALLKQNSLSLCISVNQNSAAEIIRKCALVARAVSVLSNNEITYEKSFDKIVFSNGSRILSLSSNPDGMRGYTADIVALDEAAYIPDFEEVMKAIAPTLTRNPNAELILTTTPNGAVGPFYDLYNQALTDDNWFVQHVTIHDAINQGLKNVDLEGLHTLCPDPKVFAQEYECSFTDSVSQLIDINLLQYYTNLNLTGFDFFIGIDIGRTNDKTSIAIVGRNKDNENKYLIDLRILDKCEFRDQLEEFKTYFNMYEPKLLLGDAGGIGKPIMEELNLHFNSRCKPFIFNMNNKNDCYEYFKKNIFTKQLFINNKFKKNILDDISQVRKVISENGKISYTANRNSNGHSDSLTALLLALEAERECLINNEQPFTYFRKSRL